MTKFKKALGVSSPEGVRIVANVYQNAEQVSIQVPYLKEVEIDNPPFAYSGVIRLTVAKREYGEAVNRVEKYLESLYLLKMDKEEKTNAGNSATGDKKPSAKRRRNTAVDSSDDQDRGEDTPSLYSGA